MGEAHHRVARYQPGALYLPSGPVSSATIVSVASTPELGWPQIIEGQLPNEPGETVLDQVTAQRSGLGVGDTVAVGLDGTDSSAQERQTLRIVGLVDPGDGPQYADSSFLGMTTAQVQAITDDRGSAMILATGDDSASAQRLAGHVGSAVGPDYEVVTAEKYASGQVSSGGTASVTMVLLAFAGIALFVAAIVIANTFSILVAQRTREMALLRCVGATRRQVFVSVLAESAMVGLAGSLAGVALGYGLTSLVGTVLSAALTTFPFGTVTLSVPAVVVPLVVGVTVTVAAAVLPARAATRIPPVAALRDQAGHAPRTGRVRIGIATVLVIAGASALAVGGLVMSSTQGFAVVFAGCAAAFIGVLLAAPVLVPPLARLIGAVFARLLGTPGRLAALNAVRNPRRAAATTAALMVGVTLISVLSVGAASTRATVNAQLDETFPVDYMVRAESGIPAEVVAEVRDLPSLSETTVVHSTTTKVQGHEIGITGYHPQQLAAVTSQLPDIADLRPGEVVLYSSLADQLGLEAGDSLELTGSNADTATLTVSAILGHKAAPEAAFVTQRDLARLFPDAPLVGVFAEAAPDAEPAQVSAALDEVAAGHDVTVSGTAETRATYTRTLDSVLGVTTAMLAVAMVIAVLGIANTLTLSVIERTRESGLLRALGLTRGQLRAALAAEAALLALIGTLLGAILGIVFGWAAISSMLGSSFEVVLAVPWLRLAGLTAAAVAAALLAAVLPARRAARTSVVAALADE
ncbi:ABC transporter permease [Brachybacterium sacelli]|uniref:ABC transporter permease n=1 Tax=Brachybacterium sacelli TaxID=173364 RepID=UPI0031D5CAE1